MKLLFLALCILAPGWISLGNPIAIPNPNAVFVAEENLEVQLGKENSTIRCSVTFRQQAGSLQPKGGHFAHIDVPVWIPQDYDKERVRRIDQLSHTGWRDNIQEAGREFKRLCAIRLEINGKAAEISGSYLSIKPGNGSTLPPEAYPRGYGCVVYSFELPLPLGKSGSKVTLAWRQPHLMRSKEARCFFYLPLLPIDETKAPIFAGRYPRTATIRCDKDVFAALAWDNKDACTLTAGSSATLSLSHLHPLKILVKAVGPP